MTGAVNGYDFFNSKVSMTSIEFIAANGLSELKFLLPLVKILNA